MFGLTNTLSHLVDFFLAFNRLDSETHAGLRMQIDYVEDLSSGDREWPHMEERLSQLRHVYSTL